MRRALAAEALKVATLPATALAGLATVFLAVVAGWAVGAAGPTTVGATAARAAVFAQVGMVVAGTLVVAHEYAGRQIGTSLRAVPRRGVLVGMKAVVAVVWAGLLGVVAAGASAVGAALAGAGSVGWGSLGGAVGYLWFVGIASGLAAVFLRGTVPTLGTMLVWLLIVSPQLLAVSEHARWLPDRAAAALLGSTDALLAPGLGAAVSAGWLAVLAAGAAVTFARRDA